jgi:hypothetical protein
VLAIFAVSFQLIWARLVSGTNRKLICFVLLDFRST